MQKIYKLKKHRMATKEETPMQYVNLGRSGLKVSRLGYGNWVNGLEDEEAQKMANALVKLAWDRGVNFFDTAEAYQSGQAERQLGIALKNLGVPRSDYVVTTKIFFGNFAENTNHHNNLGTSRKRLKEGLDRSLKHLQLDYVDVVFCHRYDEGTPTLETVLAMKDVIAQGKALYWATSTWPPVRVMEAIFLCDIHGCPRPIAEQCQYNMFVREEIELNYVEFFQDYGLGTTIWSPLCSGILTGKYNNGIPKGSRFDKASQWKGRFYDQYLGTDEVKKATVAKLNGLAEIAKRIGCTQTQLALAWTLKIDDVSTALLGASRESQLTENIEALAFVDKLTPEILAEIEEILQNRPHRGIDYRNNLAPLPYRR